MFLGIEYGLGVLFFEEELCYNLPGCTNICGGYATPVRSQISFFRCPGLTDRYQTLGADEGG